MSSEAKNTNHVVHVVIPCFKVAHQILRVIDEIGPEVERIWVVDDACPESSGEIVRLGTKDSRVEVVRNPMNLGVGGATKIGFTHALGSGATIVVKLDGDGQMRPSLIPDLIRPIAQGFSDYSKGNRFAHPSFLASMPWIRIVGNAVLSFWSKISSGYWSVNDPTNGFLAVRGSVLDKLQHSKLANRYFFESDLLFRLRLIDARVADFPMQAVYGDEKSSLNVTKVLFTFPFFHIRNFVKRIFYMYYLREWSIASLELPIGVASLFAGVIWGFVSYSNAVEASTATTAGQATAASLLIILGVQLLLSFISYDISSEPKGHREN